MKPSLRKTLATSRVGAVAIAVLYFVSFGLALGSITITLEHVTSNFFAAKSISGLPYVSQETALRDAGVLKDALSNLFLCIIGVCAVWLLSRWTYGAGPIRVLKTYRALLNRRNDA